MKIVRSALGFAPGGASLLSAPWAQARQCDPTVAIEALSLGTADPASGIALAQSGGFRIHFGLPDVFGSSNSEWQESGSTSTTGPMPPQTPQAESQIPR